MILKKNQIEKEKQAISTIQRNIDIITATLLATGQFTIIGIFVTPGGFRISVGGPLTGTSRLEGKSGSRAVNLIIDVFDILTAVLLITDQINVTGTFISSPERFTVNVSGPIFGVPKTGPALPDVNKIFTDFRKIVPKHFNVNPELLRKLTKE
ncbi:hypothetical protein [Ectobacillus panaciterrae]|uniref:hypothetical protein n=1 Tax=Ectobacillus panaciterrae TaxID=363872 RepID=UPI00040AB92E|nr:hypothetical protein [Ectobacillus panaciterrae]